MSPTDHAWAAGFLDGEGYIGLQRRNPSCGVRRSGPQAGRVRRDGMSWQLIITASQINPAPIQRLVDLYGGVKTLCRRSGRGKSDYWRWRISSNQALTALEWMLPYFVGKADVAKAAVSFQIGWRETKPSIGRSMPLERRQWAMHHHTEIQQLNQRFRRVPTRREESAVVSLEDRGLAGAGTM